MGLLWLLPLDDVVVGCGEKFVMLFSGEVVSIKGWRKEEEASNGVVGGLLLLI